jgi:hypothetical protein
MGKDHEMTTLSASKEVIGAEGWSGTVAAIIAKADDAEP